MRSRKGKLCATQKHGRKSILHFKIMQSFSVGVIESWRKNYLYDCSPFLRVPCLLLTLDRTVKYLQYLLIECQID
jgi:hypothetical protein